MGVKCFWIEPTGQSKFSLRRYNGDAHAREVPGSKCPSSNGWIHDAMVDVGVFGPGEKRIEEFDGDERWPQACRCGYKFSERDDRQLFESALYRRADTWETFALREAPPGAMWDANWFHDHVGWCGPDGKSLVVVLPNGHQWHIDGRCSNCTLPHDDIHKCWVRHGTPPNLTVDKAGNTCAAGAGSVQGGNWHGFLRNGELVT